jgi:hypothetical protein
MTDWKAQSGMRIRELRITEAPSRRRRCIAGWLPPDGRA